LVTLSKKKTNNWLGKAGKTNVEKTVPETQREGKRWNYSNSFPLNENTCETYTHHAEEYFGEENPGDGCRSQFGRKGCWPNSLRNIMEIMGD